MGHAFLMKQKENSMKVSTSKPNEMWCVDSGASNHMTNHEKRFSHLEKLKQLGWSKPATTPHIPSSMSVTSP